MRSFGILHLVLFRATCLVWVQLLIPILSAYNRILLKHRKFDRMQQYSVWQDQHIPSPGHAFSVRTTIDVQVSWCVISLALFVYCFFLNCICKIFGAVSLKHESKGVPENPPPSLWIYYHGQYTLSSQLFKKNIAISDFV